MASQIIARLADQPILEKCPIFWANAPHRLCATRSPSNRSRTCPSCIIALVGGGSPAVTRDQAFQKFLGKKQERKFPSRPRPSILLLSFLSTLLGRYKLAP